MSCQYTVSGSPRSPTLTHISQKKKIPYGVMGGALTRGKSPNHLQVHPSHCPLTAVHLRKERSEILHPATSAEGPG